MSTESIQGNGSRNGGAVADIACRSCGRGNRSNRQFCSECGQPLWENCYDCGASGAASELFCGSCGANRADSRNRVVARLEAALEGAQRLAGEHRYHDALAELRGVARQTHDGLKQYTVQAQELIDQLPQRQELGESAAEKRRRAAEALVNNHEYERAAGELEAIPPPLRNDDISRLLRDIVNRRDEIERLTSDIRSAIQQKQTADVALKVERLLSLQPNHQQAARLAVQLRDRFSRKAKAKLSEHRYEEALNLLQQIPSIARNDDVLRLIDQAAEMRWLLDDMRSAAVIDKPLRAVAQRALTAVPGNQAAARLATRLKERRAEKPADPQFAAANWATPPQRTRLGPPIDWLGGFSSVQVEAPQLRALVDENPGVLFTALGLALQGLGIAAVSANLAPMEKSRRLPGLSFGKRKREPSTAWGLDMTRGALKAVKLVRDGDDPPIRMEACELIRSTAAAPQQYNEIEQRSQHLELLQQLIERHDLRDQRICLNVPGQFALGRFVSLPPVDGKKLDKAAEWEARHQFPVALEDLSWDYQTLEDIIDPQLQEATERRVLLLAVKKFDLQRRLNVLDELDLKCEIMQSDCVALHNFFVHEFFSQAKKDSDDREAIGILDVGADVTHFVVSRPGDVWFRSIHHGGDYFTRPLLRELQLTAEQAEQLKREPARARRMYKLYELFEPAFEQLTNEVQRTLASLQRSREAIQIKQIYGVGGGFQLHGLLRHLRTAE